MGTSLFVGPVTHSSVSFETVTLPFVSCLIPSSPITWTALKLDGLCCACAKMGDVIAPDTDRRQKTKVRESLDKEKALQRREIWALIRGTPHTIHLISKDNK